jgi:hypothetical protein
MNMGRPSEEVRRRDVIKKSFVKPDKLFNIRVGTLVVDLSAIVIKHLVVRKENDVDVLTIVEINVTSVTIATHPQVEDKHSYHVVGVVNPAHPFDWNEFIDIRHPFDARFAIANTLVDICEAQRALKITAFGGFTGDVHITRVTSPVTLLYIQS